MKIIIRSIAFLLFLGTAGFASAQEKVDLISTSEFRVEGVCKMCKKRIENAALTKGVKIAEWDKNTQMLKVIYNNQKTNKETIQKAVAEAGHDTGEQIAPDKTYKKLPGCCAYRDGVEVH